jgi:hypothetical protein
MSHPRDHLTYENSRCRKGTQCIYGFPQCINETTYVDDDGRVHFRRRSLDDLWIVSHIPELVDELDCHIFVDIAFTVAVFMYLYKYMFKGPDRSYFHIPNPNNQLSPVTNEIKDYVDGRYLSSPEAAWRILGFHITNKNPSVRSLSVHLPGENIPQFLKEESASSLIRYFHRPLEPSFEHLTYIQYNQDYIAYHYSEDDILADDEFLETTIPNVPLRKIRKRRHGRANIARLQTISPSAGELFYLRCLLMHRPARHFRDLRIFESQSFDTFHEAAIHFGLFTNIDEGRYAMEEAEQSFIPPSQLRFLFARIILEGYPAQPLWHSFCDSLSLDFVHSFHSTERGIDKTLQTIEEFIQDSGRRLRDFGLPQPQCRPLEVVNEIEAFTAYRPSLLHNATNALSMMNDEQHYLFLSLYNDIINTNPQTPFHPTFIEGLPGRGKTFLVNAIVNRLRADGNIVLVVGTSALAASLYQRGRTAHSLFDIPVTDVRAPFILCFLPFISITRIPSSIIRIFIQRSLWVPLVPN